MKRGRARRALLLLAAVALLLIHGQSRLVTEEYVCSVASLPESFEDFRIVLLSDLHGAEFGRDNQRLVQAVREAEPDLIALTGDFVEKEADLAVTAVLLPQLAAIAPCYFVSGNHEWASGCFPELEEQLASAGIPCLHNEYRVLERGGEEVIVCGVEDPNSWADMIRPDELVEQLRAAHPDTPVILLGHRNFWVEKYPSLDVDVIVCGHAHGGIVRIPGLGGLFGTDRRLFPTYTEGAWQSGRYTMVISRGLGNVDHTLRVFNPPQVVAVTLKK